MLFSRNWQYAVRILVHLSHLEPGEQESAKTIAERVGIPGPYAGKILTALSSARLVRSKRGPGGGVMLAKAPGSIQGIR